jgi:hypothetical protein
MALKKVGDGAGSGTGNGGGSGIGDGFISGGGDGAGSGVDGSGFGLGDGYISKCIICFTNYRILCVGGDDLSSLPILVITILISANLSLIFQKVYKASV